MEHQRKHPDIAEVRALGSMVAMEFYQASTAQAVQKMAMEQGLLLLTCGAKGNVIRFLYPSPWREWSAPG